MSLLGYSRRARPPTPSGSGRPPASSTALAGAGREGAAAETVGPVGPAAERDRTQTAVRRKERKGSLHWPGKATSKKMSLTKRAEEERGWVCSLRLVPGQLEGENAAPECRVCVEIFFF